eukprot:4232525-Alexandrium_andersonii.AAC.2
MGGRIKQLRARTATGEDEPSAPCTMEPPRAARAPSLETDRQTKRSANFRSKLGPPMRRPAWIRQIGASEQSQCVGG